jgi:hypothetical protein
MYDAALCGYDNATNTSGAYVTTAPDTDLSRR